MIREEVEKGTHGSIVEMGITVGGQQICSPFLYGHGLTNEKTKRTYLYFTLFIN